VTLTKKCGFERKPDPKGNGAASHGLEGSWRMGMTFRGFRQFAEFLGWCVSNLNQLDLLSKFFLYQKAFPVSPGLQMHRC
jgi:hypothetical protein